MIVEICANSYESASNALKAGADRIELCSELALGGITPSHGLIQKVVEELSIDVNVLVRPRSGDFNFSDDEFDVMKRDIKFCKDVGCHGIVSGILKPDNTIDIERTKELIELAKPLSFTFHRAFDWVSDPKMAIQKLIEIGVNRILTSGQKSSALDGITLLTSLMKTTNERIIIMPGAGVNQHNIIQFKDVGFKEIHFSGTKLHKRIEVPNVSMNSQRFFDETQLAISDLNTIKHLIALVK
jgi:copper homeostasis protein